jgi:uncharacterized protein YdaU (DUF1376 family)
MHYYQFHIGDYRASTAHLSNEEDLAFRRLLDMYYDTEKPIPTDTQWVARRLRIEPHVVRDVLNDMFVCGDDGWRHDRCDLEIAHYHQLAERNRENGRKGGRPKKPSGLPQETQVEPKITLTSNHEPITNNHKPKRESQRGSRLAPDFPLSDEWVGFCRQHRPELDPRETFDGFRDYWIAQPGQKGVKTDWTATWRNWVRRQQTAKKTASEARLTQMAALTRGLATPKPAPANFWAKPEQIVEVSDVERKRLL